MIVFVPIRSTEILSENVRKSILAQTIKSEIQLIENIPYSVNGRKFEHEARDLIRVYVQSITDKYVVTNDSDVRHLFVDNFECMASFLDKNQDVGAVSLWNGRNNLNHIAPECCMWRREILGNICQLVFDGADHLQCCCDRYKKSIEEQGFKWVYLDTIKRIKS